MIAFVDDHRDVYGKLLQPLHLRLQQAVVLLLPIEVRRLTDPGSPIDLRNRHSVRALLQNERLPGVRPEGRRSQNADAFMVFRSFPAREISAENSNVQWSSFRGADHCSRRHNAMAQMAKWSPPSRRGLNL